MKIFKESRFADWLLGYGGGLVIWMVLMTYYEINVWMRTLIVVIWLIIMKFMIEYLEGVKINHLNSLLLEACQCEDYLQKVESLAKRTRNPYLKALLLLNISEAYIQRHNLDEVKRLIDEFELTPNKKVADVQECIFYIRMAEYYSLQKDYQKSDQHLGYLSKILMRVKMRKEMRNQLTWAYENLKLFNGIEVGKVRNGVQTLEQYREKGHFPKLYCVEVTYHLGRLYLENKQIEKAKKAFSYVITYGGDTWMRSRAEQEFDQINQ